MRKKNFTLKTEIEKGGRLLESRLVIWDQFKVANFFIEYSTWFELITDLRMLCYLLAEFNKQMWKKNPFAFKNSNWKRRKITGKQVSLENSSRSVEVAQKLSSFIIWTKIQTQKFLVNIILLLPWVFKNQFSCFYFSLY